MPTNEALLRTVAEERTNANDFRAKAAEARRRGDEDKAELNTLLANISFHQAENAQALYDVQREAAGLDKNTSGLSKQLDGGEYNGP